MNKNTIIQLAKLATNKPNLSIEITNLKAPVRTYQVLGFININFNGQWYVQIRYVCHTNNRVYSQDSSEFGSFKEKIPNALK